MKIEVGYFPKRYYSSKPDISGFFPFALDGKTKYVFDISGFYLPESNDEFIPSWMTNVKAFPIYFCAGVSDFWQEEFEEECATANIRYHCIGNTKDHSVLVSEIENEKQLKEIFPFFIKLGASNDLVLWSSNKNVYSLEEREWTGVYEGGIRKAVVVTMEADTSIFWIGYDGHSITTISNQSQFSTYEKITQTFPEFIIPNFFKFAEHDEM